MGFASPVLFRVLMNGLRIQLRAHIMLCFTFFSHSTCMFFLQFIESQETISLRLSSRQITLLLSSIWAQSMSPANTPQNFEAIAHTYSLVLLFSRAKVNALFVVITFFCLFISLHFVLGLRFCGRYLLKAYCLSHSNNSNIYPNHILRSILFAFMV